MNQLAILKERYNKIYQYLESIAADTKVRTEDRLQALVDMAKVSRATVEIHRDAPMIAVVQRRKLEAQEKGALFFDFGGERAHVPPIYDWNPDNEAPPPIISPAPGSAPLPPDDANDNDDSNAKCHWTRSDWGRNPPGSSREEDDNSRIVERP
jgi:hypothetical protein